MSKRYYWLKLKEDFFDSKRIKKLRKLAGGDTFTIIYLKMQLKAMKSDGVLQFDGLEKTFAEELALDIDEEPENVQLTLSYLISCGLVETSDDISFFLPFSVENTGTESGSAQRVREFRARKAAAELSAADNVLQCNNCVTERKSKIKEIEKEIEIDPAAKAVAPRPHVDHFDYDVFKTVYNNTCKSLPSCRVVTEKRKKAIRTFFKEFGLDSWQEICRKAESSRFLTGDNDRGWKADIDFLLRPDKAARILEGAYQDLGARGVPKGASGELGQAELEAIQRVLNGG